MRRISLCPRSNPFIKRVFRRDGFAMASLIATTGVTNEIVPVGSQCLLLKRFAVSNCLHTSVPRQSWEIMSPLRSLCPVSFSLSVWRLIRTVGKCL